MTEAELQAIKDQLAAPAGRDYDIRCENGSCHKASRLADHVEELVGEVERLRTWLRVMFEPLGDNVNYAWAPGDGPGSWAKDALAGECAPEEVT